MVTNVQGGHNIRMSVGHISETDNRIDLGEKIIRRKVAIRNG